MACKMVYIPTTDITSCFAHVLMNPVPVLWLHLALVLVLLHHLHCTMCRTIVGGSPPGLVETLMLNATNSYRLSL